MEVKYLTASQVIALHQRVMHRMGWNSAPLRSEDLLESAIQRAQAAAFYGGADLVEQACLLAIGISQNQPFLDGNKRTALYSLVFFLRSNGLDFDGKPLEFAAHLIAVSERTSSLEEATQDFVQWVRERVIPREQTK
jgi:death-on-curing protein